MVSTNKHTRAPNTNSLPTSDPRHICDTSDLSKCIPETLHVFTPLLRVIFLLPLFFVLFSPRVVYLPAESQPETVDAESAPLVGQSSVLFQEEGNEIVSGGESSKYGTFAHGRSESSTVTGPEVSQYPFCIAQVLICIVTRSSLSHHWLSCGDWVLLSFLPRVSS